MTSLEQFRRIFSGGRDEAAFRKIVQSDFERTGKRFRKHLLKSEEMADGEPDGSSMTDQMTAEQARRRDAGIVDDEPDTGADDDNGEPEVLDRPRVLRWLLHSARGQSLLRGTGMDADRLADLLVEASKDTAKKAARKRQQTKGKATMNHNPLETIVKDYGMTTLAKRIVEKGSSIGLSEHEFVRLATEDCARFAPGGSPAAAFSKAFTSNTPEGELLRKAHAIVKEAGFVEMMSLEPLQVGGEAAMAVNDPSEAIAQLQQIGRSRWPTATAAVAFERAFSDPVNKELAAKAHQRPAPSAAYQFPR